MAGAAKPFVLLPPELLHGLYARLALLGSRRKAAWSAAVIAASEAHLRTGDLCLVRAADRGAQTMLGTLRAGTPGRPARGRSALAPEGWMHACLGAAVAQKAAAGSAAAPQSSSAAASDSGIVLAFAGSASDLWSAGHSVLPLCAGRRLPVLFVTQTKAADSVPLAAAGSRPRLPRVAVDADDTVAIYRVFQECSRQARTGGAPTWLDCQVLPLKGRSSAAQPPLLRMEQYLRQRNLFIARGLARAKTQLHRSMGDRESLGEVVAL